MFFAIPSLLVFIKLLKAVRDVVNTGVPALIDSGMETIFKSWLVFIRRAIDSEIIFPSS